jgi:nucleotide-binding universal stress UspA family protein
MKRISKDDAKGGILVAIDMDDKHDMECTLPRAAAESRKNGLPLTVITVVPGYGMSMVGQFFPKNFEEKLISDVETRLETLLDQKVLEGCKVTCPTLVIQPLC